MNRKMFGLAAALMLFTAACAGDTETDELEMDEMPAAEEPMPAPAPAPMPADTMGGMMDTTMTGDTGMTM